MSERMSLEEIRVGSVLEATLTPNPREDASFPLCTNHVNGMRAPKVVLSPMNQEKRRWARNSSVL